MPPAFDPTALVLDHPGHAPAVGGGGACFRQDLRRGSRRRADRQRPRSLGARRRRRREGDRRAAPRRPPPASDCALILDGDPRRAARLGADGAHVEGVGEALDDALESLKPERIVGVGGLRMRDDAMTAGEKGADYVMFGEPRGAVPPMPLELLLERVGWWAEIFETPCVAYAESIEAARRLAEAGRGFRRGRRRCLGRAISAGTPRAPSMRPCPARRLRRREAARTLSRAAPASSPAPRQPRRPRPNAPPASARGLASAAASLRAPTASRRTSPSAPTSAATSCSRCGRPSGGSTKIRATPPR